MTTQGKIDDLKAALVALDFDVQQMGATLFVDQWAIHCGLTGNVQARNMHDDCERFGLGTMRDSAEDLAEKFADVVALW